MEVPPDGTGTVVAVLDSGIQRDHLAFSNDDKVLLCKNFVDPNDNDCEDVNGHGTQCAGLACGLPFEGVDGVGVSHDFASCAPGARLMVCKVTHDYCEKEDISGAMVAALTFITEHNSRAENEDKKVDVVSISIGFPSFNNKIALAVHEALQKDIIVVCCANNEGTKVSNPIFYPGRLGQVLCIGACDNTGQPANFSSEGREIDFLDIGVDVLVPISSKFTATGKRFLINEVILDNGTSFSTPLVAGLICRLLQDLKRLSTGRNASLFEDMHNVWCMRSP